MSWNEDWINDEADALEAETKALENRRLSTLFIDFFWFLIITKLAFFLLACVCRADQEITVKPGRLKKITTQLDGKKYLWRGLGDFDLIEDTSGKHAMALFPTPGKFELVVVTAKADEPLIETIRVTVEGAVPPNPNPPAPNPPGPVDDLSQKIGTAWQMEFAPDKGKSAKALASVYRYGKSCVADSKTWGDVFGRMTTQAIATDAYDKIPNVQKAIQAQLVKSLPTATSTPVDASMVSPTQVLFERIAVVLEGLQ